MSYTSGETGPFAWHPNRPASTMHMMWKLVVGAAMCGAVGWAIGRGNDGEQKTDSVALPSHQSPPIATTRSPTEATMSPAPVAPAVVILNKGASHKAPAAAIEPSKALEPARRGQRAAEGPIMENDAPALQALSPASNYEDLRRQMLGGRFVANH